MKSKSSYFLFLLVASFSFFSCVSTAEEAPSEPVAEETAPEPVAQEPEATEEPEAVEEVVVNDETGYEVSKELYDQTFDEMKLLIEKLNGIISDRNYEKWKLYLSDKYIRTYNDKAKLKEISENSQILADNNIVLNNLKDYFEWVVVPSRSKASVDDILFEDETRIKAYMFIKNKRSILYQLENIEDKWLISVW